MRKKHVKVTIPEKDQAVMLWLQEQMNMSYSIRTLIKRHIIENGGELVDVTCESLDSLAGRVVTKPVVETDEKPKVRRGRPAKKETVVEDIKPEEVKSVVSEPAPEPVVTKPIESKPVEQPKPQKQKVQDDDYSSSFDFSGDFGAGDMDISDMLNI